MSESASFACGSANSTSGTMYDHKFIMSHEYKYIVLHDYKSIVLCDRKYILLQRQQANAASRREFFSHDAKSGSGEDPLSPKCLRCGAQAASSLPLSAAGAFRNSAIWP